MLQERDFLAWDKGFLEYAVARFSDSTVFRRLRHQQERSPNHLNRRHHHRCCCRCHRYCLPGRFRYIILYPFCLLRLLLRTSLRRVNCDARRTAQRKKNASSCCVPVRMRLMALSLWSRYVAHHDWCSHLSAVEPPARSCCVSAPPYAVSSDLESGCTPSG